MIFDVYRRLYKIALEEFGDIVVKGEIIRLPSGAPLKLRLYLLDNSFVDICKCPKHFHNGSEENVVESL